MRYDGVGPPLAGVVILVALVAFLYVVLVVPEARSDRPPRYTCPDGLVVVYDRRDTAFCAAAPSERPLP